ncbi:MAG: hypothetical protein AAFR81_24950 [Chloroflexota bacterium]
MREFEKQLRQVDWQNLQLEQTPEWIRAFASDDEQTRKNAYVYFDQAIVNNGTESPEDVGKLEDVLESEGLVFAVPILIELLRDNAVVEKQRILDVLNGLVWCIHLSKFDTLEPYRSRAMRVYDIIHNEILLYRQLYDSVNDFGKAVIEEILETYRETLLENG